MSFDQETTSFPFRPIIIGSLVVLLSIIILGVLLALITEFGWTGTVLMPKNYYLLIVYVGIIIGSITAGKIGKENGWLVGVGVGVLSSLFLLILTFSFGDHINWLIYIIKTIINGFIGVFGGIIGVNLSERKS